MMIKGTRILALVCMICMLACIVLPGSFSAAETAQAGENETATTFEFVNEYESSGSYTWDVSKKIEGRPFRKGEQFTFTIEALDGAPLPRNADGEAVSSYAMVITGDEEGDYTATRSLPAIPFTNTDLGNAPSKTFRYRISENPGDEEFMTYDPDRKTLTLYAEDQGDGTIAVTRVTDGDEEEDTSFTNVYARTCSAAVTKIWDDAENQDGKRPDELMTELHRQVTRTLGEAPDGKTEDVIVAEGVSLNRGNNWTYRVNSLPCWDQWGNTYSYFWKEYILEGENKVYPSEDEHIITFNDAEYTSTAVTTENTEAAIPLTETKLTNRHEPELIDLTVCKVWDDGDNEQGMRPTGITVMLYANNRPTGLAVKLGAEPAFINNSGTETYSGVVYEGGGTVTETEGADPFTATLKNLPVYIAGARQSYTWLESDTAIDRDGNEKSLGDDLYYSVTEYSISGNTTTITNRYDTQLTSLSLVKVWDDADNRNGVRPASVQVTLRAVNADYSQQFTLDSDNNWMVLATDLPRILDGKVLQYEWVESPLPDGYILTDADGEPADAVDADADDERIATMVNKLPMGTLKVTKKVTVDDGKIPAEELYFEFTVSRETADGTTEYMTPEGKPGTDEKINRIKAGETVTFENLSLGTYQVTELGTGDGGKAQIKNYTLTVETENSGSAVLNADGGETGVTLENAYTRKRGSLKVTKKVTGPEDGEKADLTFRVRVKDSDGAYYLPNVTTADADKAWTTVSEDSAASWTNLPYGTYTVEEDAESAVIDRYLIDEEQSVMNAEVQLDEDHDGKASAALENVYLPQRGALRIVKKITGTNILKEFDTLSIRIRGPEGFDLTVTYNMFKNGEYTIQNIPNGVYTIEEENAGGIAGHLILRKDSVTTAQATVTRGSTTAVTLTNNYDTAVTEATVRKVWDDGNNQDGVRPESIVMTLSNGMQAELNEENEWTATIGNLPTHDAAGKTITYTWTEPQIRGYRQQSVTTNGSETVFVNVHIPETTSVTVVKVWDDADNAAGLRPVNLRVSLSNGSTYYLNENNGWTITVNGLPAYSHGKKISYSWSEQSVLGYTSTKQTNGTVTTFTNHYPGSSNPEDGGGKTIRLPDKSLITIEDLPTPLGVGGIINHVGDTFE